MLAAGARISQARTRASFDRILRTAVARARRSANLTMLQCNWALDGQNTSKLDVCAATRAGSCQLVEGPSHKCCRESTGRNSCVSSLFVSLARSAWPTSMCSRLPARDGLLFVSTQQLTQRGGGIFGLSTWAQRVPVVLVAGGRREVASVPGL